MQGAQPLAKSEEQEKKEPAKAVQVQIAASKVVVHQEQQQSVFARQEATKPQAKQAPAPEKVPNEPKESENDDIDEDEAKDQALEMPEILADDSESEEQE